MQTVDCLGGKALSEQVKGLEISFEKNKIYPDSQQPLDSTLALQCRTAIPESIYFPPAVTGWGGRMRVEAGYILAREMTLLLGIVLILLLTLLLQDFSQRLHGA